MGNVVKSGLGGGFLFVVGALVGGVVSLALCEFGYEINHKQTKHACKVEYFDFVDFANMVDKSIYSIWGAASNKLKPYIKDINGHKRIHKSALELYKK